MVEHAEPGSLVTSNLIVEQILGRGGMALVYQVRDVTDGSRHALKVLESEDDQFRQRMLKEGELIASLDSPHLVRLHGELRVDGRPGLLMELARGPTLLQFLKLGEPSLETALTLFRGICMGVGTAHAAGIVHRDLKPSNVLLHFEKGFVTPKVVDFGVAKDLIDGQGLTRSGVTFGTPRYMAPEQLSDCSRVDRRTDIWALGVILYRLVTGEPPFQGRGPDLLYQITLGRYTPPRRLRPGLPDEVVFAIDECLHREVEKRLPDVPALMGVLEGATSLGWDSELGTLAPRARRPRTKRLTTLPLSDMPEELQGWLDARNDWELEVDSLVPRSESPVAPRPPGWVASTSLVPRTMTPEDLERMRAPVRPSAAVPDQPAQAAPAVVGPDPERPVRRLPTTVWVGTFLLAVGAMGAGFFGALLYTTLFG